MPTITCLEVGCKTPIKYTSEDTEVPLYCETHRTLEGRHSQVKILKKPAGPEPKPKMVIMRCPICKTRKKITESEMWGMAVPECCGARMLYHRDAKEGECKR